MSEPTAKTIEIYTTRYCPFCVLAKRLLDQKALRYTEIAVDGDADARAAMRERAGGRHTVPQIFIGGRAVGGCDDLHAMERSGQLDTLLAG